MRIPPIGFTEPVVALSTDAVLALGVARDLIHAIQKVVTASKEVGPWTA